MRAVLRPFVTQTQQMRCTAVVRSGEICSLFIPFFLCQERSKTSSFFCSLCIDGGPKQGGNIHYASSSTASNHALINSHSCECIGPLRVSNQSEHNLRNSAQGSWRQLCKHATIHRTGLFLSLSLVMQILGQSCLPNQSLWITQVQWPIYASMIHTLWWGTRWGRKIFTLFLLGCPPSLSDLLYDGLWWSICNGQVLRLMWGVVWVT